LSQRSEDPALPDSSLGFFSAAPRQAGCGMLPEFTGRALLWFAAVSCSKIEPALPRACL